MRSYLVKFLGCAALFFIAHFAIAMFLPAPIKAEYWVRPTILVKRYQAAHLASPKLILIGGSSVLFGIDAKLMQDELGLPVENFGLHANLSLDRLLREAEANTKAGDHLILALEPGFYDCDNEGWTDWRVENALAWDRKYFDALSLWKRLQAVYFAASPSLSANILMAAIGSHLAPRGYADRLEALEPQNAIVAKFAAGTLRTARFAYSAYNLDDRGDLLNTDGSQVVGRPEEVSKPGAICPRIKTKLQTFVAAAERRHVTVWFAHAPYLVDPNRPGAWEGSEHLFAADISAIGSSLLDARSDLFFPHDMFFNTPLHLNSIGRQIRTRALITQLERRGVDRRLLE